MTKKKRTPLPSGKRPIKASKEMRNKKRLLDRLQEMTGLAVMCLNGYESLLKQGKDGLAQEYYDKALRLNEEIKKLRKKVPKQKDPHLTFGGKSKGGEWKGLERDVQVTTDDE